MKKYAKFILDVLKKMSNINVNSILISVISETGKVTTSYYNSNMFDKQHIKNALELDIVNDHIRANVDQYSNILWGQENTEEKNIDD